jgi:hypothetical protein
MFLFVIQQTKSVEPGSEYYTGVPKVNAFIAGWYGQVQFDATAIKNKDAYVNSMGLGFTLTNNLSIGLEGALFTNYKGLFFENVSKGTGAYLKGGYAGLAIEPHIKINSSFDFAFPILFALGNAVFSTQKGFFNGGAEYRKGAEVFLLIMPGSELQWKLTREVSLCFGLSYRHTSGLSIGDLPYDMLDGLNSGISLRYSFY